MNRRALNVTVAMTIVLSMLIIVTTPAAAQGRGAQPRKPKPTVGAWWYKGDPQPPGAHPDLTGKQIHFRDLMSAASYDREVGDLAARGLYLDLPPWGYHAFSVEER